MDWSTISFLEYDFMRAALAAGIAASTLCAVVGIYVILNRIVFISDGIAHAAFGGIGLGYFLGSDPLTFGVASALSHRSRDRRHYIQVQGLRGYSYRSVSLYGHGSGRNPHEPKQRLRQGSLQLPLRQHSGSHLVRRGHHLGSDRGGPSTGHIALQGISALIL